MMGSQQNLTPAWRAVLLAGATASGKSQLALALAQAFKGSIINADSMQVYAQMHILTARPTKAEMADIPHYLYGHVSARTSYSTGDWLKDALSAIAQVEKAGRLPIIVGGTGLYFKALTEGLAQIPDIPPNVRTDICGRLEREGLAALHEELTRIDEAAGQRIEPNDKQRTLRALEVYAATGKTLTEWQNQPMSDPPLAGALARLVLMPARDWLYARCNQRFEAMFAGGALDEAETMAALGLAADKSAMKALGLKELIAFQHGAMTAEEACMHAQQQTRRYAKRQMTWFRNQMTDWHFLNEQEYYKNQEKPFHILQNNA